VPIRIEQDMLDVLNRSEITATELRLPQDQLERKLYERVNKVIVAAGGRWNRSRQSHVFESDPREKLGLALETGKIVDVQREFQEFLTPEDLAHRMVALAGINSRSRVLEPSAGTGRIAVAASHVVHDVFCVEVQPHRCEELRKLGLLVWEGDFLQFPSNMNRPFDAVVMNPPFTKCQDIEHVRKAATHLRSGGRLVAVMSAGVVSGSTKRHREFREWVVANDGQFEELPAKTFRESGTDVNTVLLTLTAK